MNFLLNSLSTLGQREFGFALSELQPKHGSAPRREEKNESQDFAYPIYLQAIGYPLDHIIRLCFDLIPAAYSYNLTFDSYF